MRRIATALLIALAIGYLAPVFGPFTVALAQVAPPPPPPPPTPTPTPADPTPSHSGSRVTPLGWYVMGGMFCSAAAPIAGTIILGREMTAAEVGRSTLGCFLGPVGWALGPHLFPDVTISPNSPNKMPQRTQQAHGRHISLPPPGGTYFARNEVLVEFDAGTTERYRAALSRSLQLTPLES